MIRKNLITKLSEHRLMPISKNRIFFNFVFLSCCFAFALVAAVPVNVSHARSTPHFSSSFKAVKGTLLSAAASYGANAMWIDPSPVGADFGVGNRFNVTVWVNLTQSSSVWQVALRFDTAYLNAMRAGYTAGGTSEFFIGHSTVQGGPAIDNSGGYVYYCEILLANDVRSAGSASLCWIEFQVVSTTSQTTLTLDPAESFVLDSDLNDIPITRYDATVLSTGQGGLHPANSMWIEPSNFNVNFALGARFNVTVWVSLDSPSTAWEFDMRFDTACLNVVGVGYTAGVTSDFFRGHSSITVPPIIDNSQGHAISGEALFGPDSRSAGVGSLAWVEFEVAGQASQTVLYFDLNSGYTEIFDVDYNYIPFTAYAAAIWNSPPLMFVDPSVSTVGLNMNFTVNIDVSMVSDLYNWEVKIYYDKTLLNYTGGVEGDFLNSTGGSTIWVDSSDPNYNSTHGMVYVGASLLGMIPGVNGNGTLATIGFQAYGNTTLTLSEPIMLDSQLNDTVFQTQNGSVEIGNENLLMTVVNPDKRVICQNQPLNITVTAENLGASTQTFNVTLYLNSTAIGQQQITGLAANSSFTYTYAWNASTFPPGAYLLKATADHVPGETNYDDNTLVNGTLYVEIIGDISGKTGVPDGKVDMRDIGLVARAFGTKIGDTYYSPECDLNGDGKIDMRDVGLAARHFGEHYP